MNKIKIDLNETGQGKVIVDGKDLSEMVTGISIDCVNGEIPKVKLTIFGELSVNIKGILNIEDNLV